MTIIEFFDKSPLENIASALLCRPDKIILVGDDKKPMQKAVNIFSGILKNRGVDAEIFYKTASKNNLFTIVRILSQIVDENADCTFDLTGGEDLYLVALGIVMERYGNRVKCHRINFSNDSLIDCDADGKQLAMGEFDISIDEIVAIHGGSIVTDPGMVPCTYPWVIDEPFIKDIEALWTLCSKVGGAWNSYLVGAIKRLNEGSSASEDTLRFNHSQALAAVYFKNDNLAELEDFLSELDRLGIIRYTVNADEYEIAFKDDRIKRCLTIEGQVLELFVATRLMSYSYNGGKKLYHDVMVGVAMDWDTQDDPDSYRTLNEIDVFAVKGMIPIFVSCKNGSFDVEEFYKLCTVAERFGVKYAKKVLVCHNIERAIGATRAAHLKARAEDMGIRIVDLTSDLSLQEIERKLRSLYSNS